MRGLVKSAVALLFSISFLQSTTVYGHGGVSIEADMCIMKLGNLRMHVTGYQPQTSLGEEFCEDIPAVGSSIIVLDAVDPNLKDMQIGVKIIQAETWNSAQDAAKDAEREVIMQTPDKRYPSGSITIEHSFPEAGYFVGLVTAQGEGEQALVSRFPFSVGFGKGAFSGGAGSSNTLFILIAVAVAAAVGFFVLKGRKKSPAQPA